MIKITDAKIKKMRDHYRKYGRSYKHVVSISQTFKFSSHFYDERNEYMFSIIANNYAEVHGIVTEYK
ncbi:MAG: hypothetical protein ACK5XN_29810, partial [Bacteroidota bacterium]